MSNEVRLDSSDALFVEAVHTDAVISIFPFGIGSGMEIGDIDFIMNKGNGQPGCSRFMVQGNF